METKFNDAKALNTCTMESVTRVASRTITWPYFASTKQVIYEKFKVNVYGCMEEWGNAKRKGGGTFLSDPKQTYILWPSPPNGSNIHVGNTGNLCESTVLASNVTGTIPGEAITGL